jgi:Uma2 family endonuclease
MSLLFHDLRYREDMPAAALTEAIEEILDLSAEPPPPRRRFTREDVQEMLEAGLSLIQRCELIDGDLIEKRGQSPAHAATIHLVDGRFWDLFGPGGVRVQAPIEVAAGDQEWTWPEPDVAVLAQASLEYEQRHPRGDELLVVVEVADTTVRHDAIKKRDIYARAGVPEYWVLAIGQRRLIVHRRLAQGSYGERMLFSETEEVSLGSHSIPVARLLLHAPQQP